MTNEKELLAYKKYGLDSIVLNDDYKVSVIKSNITSFEYLLNYLENGEIEKIPYRQFKENADKYYLKICGEYDEKTKSIEVKIPNTNMFKLYDLILAVRFKCAYVAGCLNVYYKITAINGYELNNDKEIYLRTGEYAHKVYDMFNTKLSNYFLLLLGTKG